MRSISGQRGRLTKVILAVPSRSNFVCLRTCNWLAKMSVHAQTLQRSLRENASILCVCVCVCVEIRENVRQTLSGRRQLYRHR